MSVKQSESVAHPDPLADPCGYGGSGVSLLLDPAGSTHIVTTTDRTGVVLYV